MDWTHLLTFALALLVGAGTPGPGIAAIVARVLGRGTQGAIAFTAGVAIGDVVWLTLAVLGVAALAHTFSGVFLAIKYAGAAYLLYLAWKMWHAPAIAPTEPMAAVPRERSWRLFLGGLSVTMGNPKVVVFYFALLPNLLDLQRVTALGYLEVVGVTLAVLTLVFGTYIVLAARARRLLSSARAVRRLNRATGTVMAGAAVAIATR
ncbi:MULTISPECIES: LysE family translocator [Pandoraea]|uniref:Lysine transporter LysE n=2 Tax=Pandoraea nosoerga TaxID=2508296 RepID=A0A5E4VKP8_9BURK|nr:MULTISPECIES: LysE family translocator [Pandoraea]MBN4665144.1 LysE family translocator [Pandoraea nosoerga]MBN4677953.1 LysE family translocator [Pandoraea nosoerga]MBN4683180.1 LysE family translocator [Pandoraea nosoerga]VVE12049.1 lysine transporter LysE [Pandoraea nosoerga]